MFKIFRKNCCGLDPPDEYFDVAPFIERRCKTPIEEIQAAVDGPFPLSRLSNYDNVSHTSTS